MGLTLEAQVAILGAVCAGTMALIGGLITFAIKAYWDRREYEHRKRVDHEWLKLQEEKLKTEKLLENALVRSATLDEIMQILNNELAVSKEIGHRSGSGEDLVKNLKALIESFQDSSNDENG